MALAIVPLQPFPLVFDYLQIKFVLDSFSQPFTVLLEETMALASKHAADKAALKIIFGSLVLISKIFYFLNYQDLPEFFEDNMKVSFVLFRNDFDFPAHAPPSAG